MGNWQAFNQLQHRLLAPVGGINKARKEYHVHMTDARCYCSIRQIKPLTGLFALE